jgi:hypothetical protein
MNHLEIQKKKEITNLEERGYKRYPEQLKNYPTEKGQMVCLFQASSEAPWAQVKFKEEHWNYYKKTSDIKNREFYWKPSNAKN